MKAKNKKYMYLIYLLILAYMGLFVANRAGYFEYSNYNKKVVTETQIKQFEQDIKDNKDIDITKYIEKPQDYQTKLSKFSLKISQGISKITVKGIKGTLKFINKIIE